MTYNPKIMLAYKLHPRMYISECIIEKVVKFTQYYSKLASDYILLCKYAQLLEHFVALYFSFLLYFLFPLSSYYLSSSNSILWLSPLEFQHLYKLGVCMGRIERIFWSNPP